MKVLLSAIACQPESGSEAKVGWDAAIAVSEHNECHVVTHVSGRKAIEQKQKEGLTGRITFHYLGRDFTWHPSRFVARIQSWLIFQKWQALLLPFAHDLHRRHRFDVTHHATYVTWRVASPLWQLPVPFVWGPIGGTAAIPREFFGILSTQAKLFEIVRQASGRIARRSRAFLDCATKSSVVVAANEETEVFFRKFRPAAPVTRLWPVFFSSEQMAALLDPTRAAPSLGSPLRLFAGGNLEGRKGVALALEAIAEVRRRGIQITYTFGGWGPELSSLRQLARHLGLDDCVEFHRGFGREDYIRRLKESEIYLLPSFRETTPITLIEAAVAGCYPVVADNSGAGEIVQRIGGTAVPAQNRTQIVKALANTLQWCAEHRESCSNAAKRISEKAAEEFGRERYIKRINEIYQQALAVSRTT
jgi:glycosyltransferase involved in cell wall biosynthesis